MMSSEPGRGLAWRRGRGMAGWPLAGIYPGWGRGHCLSSLGLRFAICK